MICNSLTLMYFKILASEIRPLPYIRNFHLGLVLVSRIYIQRSLKPGYWRSCYICNLFRFSPPSRGCWNTSSGMAVWCTSLLFVEVDETKEMTKILLLMYGKTEGYTEPSPVVFRGQFQKDYKSLILCRIQSGTIFVWKAFIFQDFWENLILRGCLASSGAWGHSEYLHSNFRNV